MTRTVPLIKSILKGFLRKWSSIFLLIIFPLLLIGIVFLSFNPDGIKKIPIGVASSSEDFEIDDYKDNYFSYLDITKYYSIEDCLNELTLYREYVCIDVLAGGVIELNVYYDNTREPVIWEILERIKSTVGYMQKERTKQMASGILTNFRRNSEKIETFKTNLIEINSQLNQHVSDVDTSIASIKRAKSDLSNTIYQMDQDINDVKSGKRMLEARKEESYDSMSDKLMTLDMLLLSDGSDNTYVTPLRSEISSARNTLEFYDQQAELQFDDLDNRIERYEDASARGKGYIIQMDNANGQLDNARNQLKSYQTKVKDAENEISSILTEFREIEELDPERLVNPVVIDNKPTYIPPAAEKYAIDKLSDDEQIKSVVKGVNLISLQTIFPKLLLLITLFLSLLISSYICLNEINSPANQRVKLVKGVFFPELFSIYVSSIIIMILPLLCVLLLGQLLFMIEIFQNILVVSILLFLLSSIFVMVGMGLVYLIKKESITLLITTFVLIFLIFFSGILLPIERMSAFAGFVAENLPGNIALAAFNKSVFYGQMDVSFAILSLLTWMLVLALIITTIKGITRN